jgi:periplasmic copper chaperone A
MRRWATLALALISFQLLAHNHGKGDIEVRHPWSRATPPGAKVAVAYLEIRNLGKQPDRLLLASTPLAKRVELHVTEREGDVLKMRMVQSIEIPERSRITLRPGGAHLMLIDVSRPLEKGERFSMKLRFQRAGEVEIELEVQELGSRHPRH